MDIKDELPGSYVLLHPDVYFDAENQQGYTGVLTEADPFTDRFYVDLRNGAAPKLFASDWLMVTKDRDEIFHSFTDNLQSLGRQDIKDLYRICLLLDSQEAEHQQTALEIASSNPAIRAYTLVTLEEKLAPAIRAAEEQQTQISRGRGR